MTILSLAAERLKRAKPEIQRQNIYCCLKCDGAQFKLYATGEIHCSHCGSMMRNLFVAMDKTQA